MSDLVCLSPIKLNPRVSKLTGKVFLQAVITWPNSVALTWFLWKASVVVKFY